MPILFDEHRRVWALQTAGSTYGLGVDGEGHLRHLYYGPPLRGTEDLPRVEDQYLPFEPPEGPTVHYEYPAWGGLYYREPCLKALFHDGGRDTRLLYGEHEAKEENGVPELVITLQDPDYPLRVRLHYRAFEETGLVERYAVVENVGEVPVMLEQVLTCAWSLPRGFRVSADAPGREVARRDAGLPGGNYSRQKGAGEPPGEHQPPREPFFRRGPG